MPRSRWWLAGLAVAALVVVLLMPLASSAPDGLERVAEDQGFSEAAEAPAFEVLPGYAIPGIADETLSTVLAGLLGVGVVFALVWLAGVLLARRSREAP